MKLIDVARVIRSKNAGPTTLTLDLLFNERAGYDAACASPALKADAIGRMYSVPAERVEVMPYPAALAIKTYQHPPRAVYLLGPEDGTLPDAIMRQHDTVILPGAYPLNVAMAATVVLYDRVMKT